MTYITQVRSLHVCWQSKIAMSRHASTSRLCVWRQGCQVWPFRGENTNLAEVVGLFLVYRSLYRKFQNFSILKTVWHFSVASTWQPCLERLERRILSVWVVGSVMTRDCMGTRCYSQPLEIQKTVLKVF